MVRDSTTAMVIIVILLVTFISIISQVYGEHDYFSSFVSWEGRPVVCLAHIPPADMYQTLKAVKSWKVAFKEYTNTDKWDYDIRIRNVLSINDCNIVVIQTDQLPPAKIGKSSIGNTDCSIVNNVCIIKVSRTYDDGKLYYDTVVHEMGHAIGLAHRLSYTMMGTPAVFMSEDVMMPVARSDMHITKASLDALIYFDNIYPIIANYTIPHGDTWK